MSYQPNTESKPTEGASNLQLATNKFLDVFIFTEAEKNLFSNNFEALETPLETATSHTKAEETGGALSDVQRAFLSDRSTWQLMGNNLVSIRELEEPLAAQPWIKDKALAALHDLMRFAKMEKFEALDLLIVLKESSKNNDKVLSLQLTQLSFLAEQLGGGLKKIIPRKAVINFYDHGGLLVSLLQLDCDPRNAKQIISNIQNQNDPQVILASLGCLLSTKDLTTWDKKYFVNFLIGQENRWFDLKQIVNFADRVKRNSTFVSLRGLVDEVRDIQENTIMPGENAQVERQGRVVERDLTFISTIRLFPGEHEQEVKLLCDLKEKNHLSDEEVRLARDWFYQKTPSEKLFHDFSDFCRHLETYELSEDQVKVKQMLIERVPAEARSEIVWWVRGRPWLTEFHSKILCNLIEIGKLNFQDSLNMLGAIQHLYFDDQKDLRLELSNLELCTANLGDQISQIAPKSKSCDDALIFHKCINLLCVLNNAGYDFCLTLKIVLEVNNIQLPNAFEFVQSLIQKPDDNELFKSLVTKPGFKYECLRDLSLRMGIGLSLKDAVISLEKDMQAPTVEAESRDAAEGAAVVEQHAPPRV
jgi:hypothetical protein